MKISDLIVEVLLCRKRQNTESYSWANTDNTDIGSHNRISPARPRYHHGRRDRKTVIFRGWRGQGCSLHVLMVPGVACTRAKQSTFQPGGRRGSLAPSPH